MEDLTASLTAAESVTSTAKVLAQPLGASPERERRDDLITAVDEPLGDGRADTATGSGDDDVSTHSSMASSSSNVAGANWRSKGRIRFVSPVRTPAGGISMVVVTVSGNASVASWNCTAEVS